MIIKVLIGNEKKDRDEIKEGLMGKLRKKELKILGKVELKIINESENLVEREKRRIGEKVKIGEKEIKELRS